MKQKKKKIEKREKRKKGIKKKGATLLSFIHTCAHVSAPAVFIVIICAHLAPILHVRGFSCSTCITMWGNLHYRTWVVYSNDEPPQKCSRSS